MKANTSDLRRIFVIIILCVTVFAAFCIPADTAYAYVEDQVFEPVETAAESLKGSDVPVSKNYQAMIQYNISTGGTRFKGSGQCWGYAEKVRRLFGGGGSTKSVKKKNTPENLYKVLKNVRPGTHVRFGYSKTGSGAHSIAVYKVTKDMIYYSDANVDYNNGIAHHAVSLENAHINKYSYIMWYIQPTGGYKASSAQLTGFSYDLKDRIELAWKPVSGAKSYTVYRSSSKNGKYNKLKTVKSPLYTDKNALSGANYYKVKPNNRSMSAAKLIYNKIITPTVRLNANAKGWAKLSWDKVKGAKKYAIYKEAYSSKKGEYLKLIKTTKDTSFSYKCTTTEDENLYVRALASNSQGNSAYNRVIVHRFAPKGKIFSQTFSETYNSYDFYCGVAYDPTLFDYLELHLLRSEKKNGTYEQINSTIVYGSAYGGYYTGQIEKDDFDYKTTKVLLSDNYWEYGKTYYYKVEAVTGDGMWYSYPGLDSAKVKITTPDITTTETTEEFGGGTLRQYADGTLLEFIDSKGNSYTKNLSQDYWYLYYEDDLGQKYKLSEYGQLYKYDAESDSYEYVYPDE